MYRTVAPVLAASRAGPVRALPVRAELAWSRRFRTGPPLVDDGLDRYFADMAAVFGRDYDATARARATAYTSMAANLVAALAPRVGPIDHIVLAHATPDIDCRASAGCFLAGAAGGQPMVFGVSDQGVVAPFTALRLAGELRRGAPPAGRSVVLVLDQSTLPWRVDRPDLVPAYDAAAALVLRSAPAEQGVLLGQYTAVAPDEVPGVLDTFLEEVAGRCGAPVTLVAGRGIPPVPPDHPGIAQVWRAPADALCTAVWAGVPELAGRRGPGFAVLAEYDPDLRYLGLAALDLEVAAC